MEISKDELESLVKQQVQEELRRHYTPKVVTGWLQLRKQIDEYCKSHMYSGKRRRTSYSSIQQMFYVPIKKVLDLYRIDEMSEEQVTIAREIFEFLCKEMEKADKEKEHNYRK